MAEYIYKPDNMKTMVMNGVFPHIQGHLPDVVPLPSISLVFCIQAVPLSSSPATQKRRPPSTACMVDRLCL